MKKVKVLLFATLASFVVSCDNYFDINDNPNDLHTDEALPPQFLPAAQLGCHRVQASTMNRLGLLFSNPLMLVQHFIRLFLRTFI